MAYIQKVFNSEDEWHHPQANRAGEFVGNKPARDPFKYETIAGEIRHRTDVYIGKPGNWLPASEQDLKEYSSCQKQISLGLVGLYLKADNPHIKESATIRFVDTDVLLEEVASGQCPPSQLFQAH